MKIRKHFEEKAANPRYMNSLYPGHCRNCGKAINVGDLILWAPIFRAIYCEQCGPEIKYKLEN